VNVLATPRLNLRWLRDDDAPFILELLNEPDFLRNIGDRGVRSLDDARAYVANGPAASYARHGFGLYLVADKGSGDALGICGLIRRESLPDVDVGFAFLARHRGRGYASEAARVVLERERATLGLRRVVAIVNPDNQPSIRVLEKLGLGYERQIQLSPEGETLALYAIEWP
jgi:RimJ/RimL family protein N-acetyltransferase